MWWLAAVVVIGVVAAAIIFFIKPSQPTVPPGLVEQREAISRILDDANKIADIDIRPLAELEAKRNYRGAVSLLEQALAVNTAYEANVASLLTASNELAALASGVKPDALAVKARDAFGVLTKFAEAEKKFYGDRRALYEVTWSYYVDLAAKKKPAIPEGLQALVDAVNADLQQARELRQQFASALQAFDEAFAVAK